MNSKDPEGWRLTDMRLGIDIGGTFTDFVLLD
ncbi:MAG: hypothetical protein HW373_1281, partial [Deltaproteobacteria bacterium]|nr:hypothetical protein [Deltaproteobacteria bacterium]